MCVIEEQIENNKTHMSQWGLFLLPVLAGVSFKNVSTISLINENQRYPIKPIWEILIKF